MSSILTNNSATAALQTLRSIASGMDQTQGRISSGLKVGSASDNAAYWSIATTMRSDAAALGTVQDAMGLGAAKIDTAYAGMESAIDVVKQIKNKLVTAQESSADKSKIQEELKQLQDQLKSIASSASFSGENFLEADITNAAGNEIAKSVVSSFTRDASGNVKVQSVDYKLSSSTVLFDTGAAAGKATGILDSTFKIDGKRTEVEVTTAKPVTTTGKALADGGSSLAITDGIEVYTTAGNETYVRYNTEKFDAAGASLGWSPERDANGNDLWVKVVNADPATAVAPNDQVAKDAAGTDYAPAADKYLIVTAPQTQTYSVAATDSAALAAASATVSGGVATVGSDTYIKLDEKDVWVKAEVHTTATDEYQDGVKGIKVGTDYYAIDTENQSIAGPAGDVTTNFEVSVSTLDLTKLGDLATQTGFSEEEVLDAFVSAVDKQLSAMTSAAAQLGSLSSRIDMQSDFVSKLSDTLDSGIGRLVDADMNEESTRLKALQTQQQLAIQALSIANSDSQNILSLFR